MKFNISNIPASGSKCRLGKLYDLQRLPNVELETPMLLLHTKGGSVTHLTREVLHKVTNKVEALQIPLSNAAKCYNGVKGYNGNISEFIGLKEYLSYCTVHDPVVNTLHGFNKKNNISVWTVTGRVELNPERFMDMIEAFQPDMYEVMSDTDNDANSSTKRLRKSIDYSKDYLNHCVEKHKSSQVLQNSALLGVVEGGYNMRSREFCVNNLMPHKDIISGYVISGLHCNGPEVESMTFKSVMPILSHTLKFLPEEKIKIVHGCWRPDVILGLVELGIDLFDSSLVDIVTDRFGAFIFRWEAVPKSSKPLNGIMSSVNHTDTPNGENGHIVENGTNDHGFKMEIDLKDKRYFDDFSPLLEGCTCLTCKNHTKAYVHHLYNTKELLGPVLLMIHNLHHYLEYFSFIRNSIRKNLSVNVI